MAAVDAPHGADRVDCVVGPTNERIESTRVAAPDPAPPLSETAPVLPHAALLALQRNAGNRAVVSRLAGNPSLLRDAEAPKLRTALDSKLVVTPAAADTRRRCNWSASEPATVAVATYAPKGDTPLNRLPVYLEDIVSGDEAVVNVRYDPAAADVKAVFETREVDGVRITVRLQPQSVEALTVTERARGAPGRLRRRQRRRQGDRDQALGRERDGQGHGLDRVGRGRVRVGRGRRTPAS